MSGHPDPVLHKRISFIKSAFRVAAGLALAMQWFVTAGLLFIFAELLGVAEEMV